MRQTVGGADTACIISIAGRMCTGVWWQPCPVGLRRGPGIQQKVGHLASGLSCYSCAAVCAEHRAMPQVCACGGATDLQRHCQAGISAADELRSLLHTLWLTVRAGEQKQQSLILSMPMAASSQTIGLLPAIPRPTGMPTASCTP